MSDKSPDNSDAKCKARPNTAGVDWSAIADDAASTADLPGACLRGGVSLTELLRARGRSPEVDGLFSEVDELLRLTAAAAVTARAAAGDLRAITALTDGTLAALTGSRQARHTHDVLSRALTAALADPSVGLLSTPETPYLEHQQCPACKTWLSISVSGTLGIVGIMLAIPPIASATQNSPTRS